MTLASRHNALPTARRRSRPLLLSPVFPTRLRAALTLCLASALVGCATVDPTTTPSDGAALSGRLSVKVDAGAGSAARSMTAGFELSGRADNGTLDLTSPLGTLLARARWTSQGAVLVTPQGERRFQNLPALTRELLGEALPVAALYDWLRGRPWADAESIALASPPDRSFSQLGWVVNLERFDDAEVTAHRADVPPITVRVKLNPP